MIGNPVQLAVVKRCEKAAILNRFMKSRAHSVDIFIQSIMNMTKKQFSFLFIMSIAASMCCTFCGSYWFCFAFVVSYFKQRNKSAKRTPWVQFSELEPAVRPDCTREKWLHTEQEIPTCIGKKKQFGHWVLGRANRTSSSVPTCFS